MDGAWEALLNCAIALAVNVVVHLLVYRWKQGYMRAVFAGFGAGLLVLGVGQALRVASHIGGLIEYLFLLAGDLTIYGLASFLFFNFINAGESAIRIRILRELEAAPAPLSESALLEIYNDRVIIDTRLGRMIRNHQVELVDGRYRLLHPTLPWMANFFHFLKQVLLRRTSEFETDRS